MVTLLGAMALGWWLASTVAVPSSNGSSPPPSSKTNAASPSSKDLDALRRENDALQQRLAQIEEERKNLGRDYLQLALKQSMDAPSAKTPETSNVRARWDAAWARMNKDEWNAFDNLDKMVNLMLEMAGTGEAGIRFMGTVALDKTKTDQERQMALQLLSRMRHPAAFNFLAGFDDDHLMELDFPYDLICNQVASLSTGEIAPRVPMILDHIGAELGKDNYSPERAEVLTSLALVHHDARALGLLQDPRILEENVQGALTIAQQIHTPDALAFVQRIESGHTQTSMRDRARGILQNW
jgi:hypothetical protein